MGCGRVLALWAGILSLQGSFPGGIPFSPQVQSSKVVQENHPRATHSVFYMDVSAGCRTKASREGAIDARRSGRDDRFIRIGISIGWVQ
jgi:hypothetical protein